MERKGRGVGGDMALFYCRKKRSGIERVRKINSSIVYFETRGRLGRLIPEERGLQRARAG